MKPFAAWIALSSAGHPAYFIGIYTTKKALKQYYSFNYGADLEVAGYKAKRVIVSPASTNVSDDRR